MVRETSQYKQINVNTGGHTRAASDANFGILNGVQHSLSECFRISTDWTYIMTGQCIGVVAHVKAV